MVHYSNIEHSSGPRFDAAKAAHELFITQALALRNVDADLGEFTHTAERVSAKLEARIGSRAAVRLTTVWAVPRQRRQQGRD